MAAVITLLRGVNVGGHHQVSMEALRRLYESLGLQDVQTYIQSGNVVFTTKRRDLAVLTRRIEDAIEKSCGFRPDVVVRTCSEMKDVVAGNPYAARPGVEPGKLVVSFLASQPAAEAIDRAHRHNPGPEEMWISGSEIYIYFPNGIGRSKLSMASLEKALGTAATGRNWNTVTKLLELAEKLESSQ